MHAACESGERRTILSSSIGGLDDFPISCINKTDRQNPHVEAKEHEYFVSKGGKTADVIFAIHDGHKYIKTTADGLQPNNMLSLPECP